MTPDTTLFPVEHLLSCRHSQGELKQDANTQYIHDYLHTFFKNLEKLMKTTTYCDLLVHSTSKRVCANFLVLGIQGQEKNPKYKQLKTKEFRRGGWGKEKDCQQVSWNTLNFEKNKYFVLLLLHVKNLK